MLNDDGFRDLLLFLDRPWAGYRKVRKGVKKRVRRHLFEPPPSGPFRMILLRNNLLTYRQGHMRRSAFERIVSQLIPRGYLVVGSHETIPETSFPFVRDQDCAWVYRLKTGRGAV